MENIIQKNKEISDTAVLISEEVSKRITSLRFLLIVLVIFIHNNYTAENLAGSNVIFNQSTFGKYLQLFISNGIANCAVPVFFMISSFLQFVKEHTYTTILRKKARSLFLPFMLWPILNILFFVILKLASEKLFPSMIDNPGSMKFFEWTFKDWFKCFFGYVGNGNLYLFQFWFLRDLIVLTIFSPLLKLLEKEFSYFFLFVCFAFYICDVKLFLFGSQSLFYYVAGLFWAHGKFDLIKISDGIKWKAGIPVFLFMFWFNCLFRNFSSVLLSFTTLTSCFLILKFSLLLIQKEKIYGILEKLSAYSFFLFAIHEPTLRMLVRTVWLKFLPMKNAALCLAEYFGVTLVLVVTGTFAGFILKKICPAFFSILNGGRK